MLALSSAPVPGSLRTLLHAHRTQFAPWYGPHAFSDHAPMSALAMWGLGFGEVEIWHFYRAYCQRLSPLLPSDRVLVEADWFEACAERRAYAALAEFFDGELVRLGASRALGVYLPLLASGWVRDAFHALIRLAYGVEFGVASEISAGLAYLASVGPDARLAQAIARQPLTSGGLGYLKMQQPHRALRRLGGSFRESYDQVLEAAVLQPAARGAKPLPELSCAALAVFHATGDFFAPHLVTGLHALRVCARWLGPHVAELASVGLAAGYLAIGAPDCEPVPTMPFMNPVTREQLQLANDEHSIKLAYSCEQQARAFGDDSYRAVLAHYLKTEISERSD